MNYWILSSIAFCISKLSDRGIDCIAKAFTFLTFDLLRARRSLCINNLKKVYGDQKNEEEIKGIARDSVYSFFLTIMEFFRGYGTDVTAGVEFKGEEHYLKALEKGQGCYVVCCHLGNWEAMGAAISRKLRATRVIVKKVGSPSTDKFVRELRDRNGFAYIDRRKKGDGMKGILKALADNESIGFVMDQSRPGEPKMDFFGHPAKTNTSLAAIWQKKPAPVIHSFSRRVGVSRHIVEFFPETVPTVTDDKDKDVIENTKVFSALVEEMILKNPGQYLWMHNRWK